jgi:hypothetical protein
MNFPKIDLARIQLERAIELFLDAKDYVSTVTLAGASEEISRHILERDGKVPVVDSLKDWLQQNHRASELHKDFYNNANATRNGLKHFTDPSGVSVYVGEEEALYWVLRALMNYGRVTNQQLTPIMDRFVKWWKENNA